MFATPTITQSGNQYHVSHGDDKGLYVEFSMEAIKDEKASKEQGRAIFKDREFITIHTIGDKTKIVKRPVRLEASGQAPADSDRFPRQYAAFKNQQSQVTVGTPITEWAAITKSEAMELKAMNIHTVDALAGLGENNLTWFGARQLRDKAQAFLAQATDGSGISKLQAENEKLRTDMEALQNQMKALLEAKPKRGRPAQSQQENE